LTDHLAGDGLLTPSEVAEIFGVNPKTVSRWASLGRITAIRTLGGHRRYSEAEIQAFLADPQGVPLPRPAEE